MSAPAVDSAPLGRPLIEQIERAQLWLANGYKPVPCLRHDAPDFVERRDKSGKLVKVKNSPGKQPQGWLWKRKDTAVYGATPDSIEGWRRLRGIGEYPNLGIACGWTVAPDIDVYEAALASATEALVREHLGDTPLRRTGREPKLLLLYRAATEPLSKAATALFVNDSGQTAQLEIMGQGQQIVAHGMHPCGKPYSWGDASPDDTPLAELPAVTADQVALLIADAESLFLEHGYRHKGIEPPREAAAPSPSPKPHRTADPAGPFRAVNDAAMANLDRWVPQLFGDDARDDRHGGYRVSSDALGRDLEEDISITRDGIVDFGVHDLGDTNLGKRTPIDLVIEHGNAADAVAAAKWLAELTGTPFELPHQVDTHWEEGDPYATGRARAKLNGHDDGEAQSSSEKRKSAGSAKPKAKPRPNGSDGETSWGPEKHTDSGPAADLGERPVIRVALGGLPAAVASSNRMLAERSTAMYVLGDVLVTLEDTGAGLQTVPVTQTRIGLELARVARFERIARVTDDGPEWREVDPPLKVAAAIADEPGGWQSPRLAGLTEVPILRPNGRIVTTPGYDRPSRLFLCGGPFAPMPSDPKAALAALVDALGEFPFVLPHHQSAALALMLTAVIRRQLPAAPMFGISAREAGTGKGALASLAAIIATGRRAPETPWPATADEQRKVITATLIAGQPILILDNIVGVLAGAPLCVLITAETWSDRLLGASRLVQLPASALVVATGNNLTVAGDLCRRVVPIEMDAGCESPELREFERELVPWAIKNRPKLVAAALTVLAAHRKAGSPLPADFKPLGSFEEWSRTVCGALVWLHKTDPREAMAEIRANDPKRLLLTRVLVGMETLFGRQWQSVGSILDTAKTSKERAPGLIEAIEEITAKARDDKAAKIALGRWLNAEKGRVVGGLRLESQRDDHAKVNTWRADPCG